MMDQFKVEHAPGQGHPTKKTNKQKYEYTPLHFPFATQLTLTKDLLPRWGSASNSG